MQSAAEQKRRGKGLQDSKESDLEKERKDVLGLERERIGMGKLNNDDCVFILRRPRKRKSKPWNASE